MLKHSSVEGFGWGGIDDWGGTWPGWLTRKDASHLKQLSLFIHKMKKISCTSQVAVSTDNQCTWAEFSTILTHHIDAHVPAIIMLVLCPSCNTLAVTLQKRLESSITIMLPQTVGNIGNYSRLHVSPMWSTSCGASPTQGGHGWLLYFPSWLCALMSELHESWYF